MAIHFFPSTMTTDLSTYLSTSVSAGDTVILDGTYTMSTGSGPFRGTVAVTKSIALVGSGNTVFIIPSTISNTKAFEVNNTALKNVTIANISIINEARTSSHDAPAILILNSDYVSIIDVNIDNFQTGIALQGRSASNVIGNLLQGVTVAACDNGVVFSKQNDLIIRDFTEIASQWIRTAVAEPRAISGGYDSTDSGKVYPNGAITLSNCVSVAHQNYAPFYIESGSITGTLLSAENTSGLIKLRGCGPVRLSDLSLTGWKYISSSNAGLEFRGCSDLIVDGASLAAIPGSSLNLVGVFIDRCDVSSAIVQRVSVFAETATTGFFPFNTERSDDVAYLNCSYKNTVATSSCEYMFTFKGTPYAYVLNPSSNCGSGYTNYFANIPYSGPIVSTNNLFVVNSDALVPHSSIGVSNGTGCTYILSQYSGTFQVAEDGSNTMLVDAESAATTSINLPLHLTVPDRFSQTVRVRVASSGGYRVRLLSNNGAELLYALLTADDDWATVTNVAGAWEGTAHQIEPIIDTFPSGSSTSAGSFTYTSPPLASRMLVTAIGGGGCGGGGRHVATSTDALGGGGGAGGAVVTALLLPSDIGVSATAVAGAGGTGGAGSASADGALGGNGQLSSFTSASAIVLLQAAGGVGGFGSDTGVGASVDQTKANYGQMGSGGSSFPNSKGSNGGSGITAGGGGGGGIRGATNVAQKGGDGGVGSLPLGGAAGGDGGLATGVAGDPGDPVFNRFRMVGGGGGGALNGGVNGGSGGAGGFPGGGGGGGGAGNGTGSSGSGGIGGAGMVRVVTYF